MKKVSLLFVIAASLFMFACGGSSNKAVETNDAVDVAESTGATYSIDAAGSSVEWTGKKAAYGHSGVIDLSSGEIMVKDGNITGGKFIVDMTTITNTDMEDETDRAKLKGHLGSPDFFDVEGNPTSTFEITASANGEVTGNLTIKGISKSVSFPAKVDFSGDTMTGSAEFSINRTDWDIKFNSGSFFEDLAKEMIIDDMIDFKVSLKGSKAAS